MLIFCSDDPLYTDNLKFALYRSAAADAVKSILEETKEPWPRGMEMLEAMVNKENKGNDSNGPATVTDLWKAQIKRTEYAKNILTSWAATKARTGTAREMDALLIPCTVWPASEK